MGMVINTNVDALNALRNLGVTANSFSSSVQKLSSGLRITTAADDAAGLAIATKLQSQVTGLNQAQRNAQDGVSMVQTAEGALNEVQSMLQRIRELAVEAANATVGQSDSVSINTEVTALQAEISRIGNTTAFNGQKLLDGSLTGTTATAQDPTSQVLAGFVVNSTSQTAVTGVNVTGAAASTTFTLSSAGGAGTLTLSDGTNTQKLVVSQDLANTSQTLNFDKLGVSITFASVGAETAANISAGFAGKNIKTAAASANTSAVFQIGAGATDTLTVNFADTRSTALGLDTAITNFSNAANQQSGKTWAANGTAYADALITAADAAIAVVSGVDSNFGAIENRLNHTIASVGVASENLNASQSRIKDLNVAQEMVSFTKTQILQQAGTAILAQANSAPQNVLTLLR